MITLAFSTVLGALLLMGTGCSLKETADNMEDSTKNIEEQSHQLAVRTEELLRGMRQVEANNTMKNSREELVSADGDTIKLQKAMVFFAAFEFQKWTGIYTDTPADLDELYSIAVQLFFTSVDDLIPDDFNVDPLMPGGNWRSLGALAVAMDFIDYKHRHHMEGAGKEAVSMYGLVTEALKQEEKVNRGETVPTWVMKVLEWKREAVFMLQIRHNYYPAMILCRLTPFESSLTFQIRQRYWGSSFPLADVNYAQLKEWGNWLRHGQETRDLLTSLKIRPKFNNSIQISFNNLKWEKPPERLLTEDFSFIRSAQAEFLTEVANAQKEYGGSIH